MGFILRLSSTTKLALVAALAMAATVSAVGAPPATISGGGSSSVNSGVTKQSAIAYGTVDTSASGQGQDVATTGQGALNTYSYTPKQASESHSTIGQDSSVKIGEAAGAGVIYGGSIASHQVTGGGAIGLVGAKVDGLDGSVRTYGTAAGQGEAADAQASGSAATQGQSQYTQHGEAAVGSLAVGGGAFAAPSKSSGPIEGIPSTDVLRGNSVAGLAPSSYSSIPSFTSGGVVGIGAAGSLVGVEGQKTSSATQSTGKAATNVDGPYGANTYGLAGGDVATSAVTDSYKSGKAVTGGLAGGAVLSAKDTTVIGGAAAINAANAGKYGQSTVETQGQGYGVTGYTTEHGTAQIVGQASGAATVVGPKAGTLQISGVLASSDKNSAQGGVLSTITGGASGKNEPLYQAGATQGSLSATQLSADGKKSGYDMHYSAPVQAGAKAGGEANFGGQVDVNAKGNSILLGSSTVTGEVKASQYKSTADASASGKGAAIIPGAVSDKSGGIKAGAGGSGTAYGTVYGQKSAAGAEGSAIGGGVGSSQATRFF